MAYPDFYNLNEHRSFPLVNPSNELTDGLLVDCGFTFGPRAEFNPAVDSVSVVSVKRVGDDLEIELLATTGTTFSFVRYKEDPFGAMEYVEAPGGPLFGVGYLVTGSLAIYDQLSEGEDALDSGLLVEPAVSVSQLHHMMTSLNIGNTKRIVADECCAEVEPEEPGVPEVEPIDEETVFNVATGLTGDIIVKAGYNMGVSVSSVENSITLAPALGDGGGLVCDEVWRYVGDPGSGGVDCKDLIHSITGVIPSNSGAFQFIVSNGFELNISPETFHIDVHGKLEETVICAEDVEEEEE